MRQRERSGRGAAGIPPPGAIRRARGGRRGTPPPGRGTHTRKGSLGSEVSVILKETFDMVAVVRGQRVLLYRRGL